MEWKGCESIIHDHDCDLWVTMVGWVDVPYSDWGDFRRRRAADISSYNQFLPQDVAFSIHLSDNRFTARPLATTVVSPPRKWAPWVDISTPQSASARFFGKCPLRPCLCFVHSVIEQLTINWCRWECSQMNQKNSCRAVTNDILTFRWLSPPACHIALSGPVTLWDPLIICQSMIPLTPGH